MGDVFAVLHVCMGNICRSPMAELLTLVAAEDLVGDKAQDLLYVHSAGTGGWHAGEPMDRAAARQVRARGGDPDAFAARKLRTDMIDASDLVLTATAEQQEYVAGLRPDAAARTFVLGEFGRLLRRATPVGNLPAFVPSADVVRARGVALVAAVEAARGGRPAGPADELDDPWGRGDEYFGRVADEIEETVRPFVAALLA
jgi:protein-tyrosine phosphatase